MVISDYFKIISDHLKVIGDGFEIINVYWTNPIEIVSLWDSSKYLSLPIIDTYSQTYCLILSCMIMGLKPNWIHPIFTGWV